MTSLKALEMQRAALIQEKASIMAHLNGEPAAVYLLLRKCNVLDDEIVKCDEKIAMAKREELRWC